MLSPIKPQKLAGPRIDPTVSEPKAISTISPAMAAAEPDEEPPVVRVGAAGFIAGGWCVLSPERLQTSSSVCVLPIKLAPESKSIRK